MEYVVNVTPEDKRKSICDRAASTFTVENDTALMWKKGVCDMNSQIELVQVYVSNGACVYVFV